MNQLTDNAWIKRVGQLQQDTQELFSCWQGEFDLEEDFEEFLRAGFKDVNLSDAEQRVIKNALSRIVAC